MRRTWAWPFAALLLFDALAPAAAAPLSEAARWLQGYIRIDTSNPPGRERPAAEYLADILHGEGIATQLLVTAGDRASLYARLPADHPGRGALLLLHHLDVVPAGPGWTHPPFAGEVADGRLWGRGAIDAKSLGIAELAALVKLKRSGVPRSRDVVFLAVADEESGGALGTARLLREHPELFRDVEAVINEGGANHVAGGRLAWWGVEVAQKRPLWLEVEADGRGGHGSGFNPHSASHQLIEALARLLALPPHFRVDDAVRRYLEAIAPYQNAYTRKTFLHIRDFIGDDGPRRAMMPGMANLFLDSVQVTVVDTGQRINVIPARARAKIDIRLLPETDADAFLERVRQALGDSIQVRVLLTSPPSAPSPSDTWLFAAARDVLGREAPVVPAFISGFTDSRYFRERGTPAYGVSPFVLERRDLATIHGPDERIPVRELDRGVERMVRLVERCVAASEP